MSKFSETKKSKYWKASHLNGKPKTLTVSKVEIEDVGGNGNEDDVKPVMYFNGEKMGLVLNATNGDMMVDHFGDEMDEWKNKRIEMRPEKTRFQNKRVDCIRIYPEMEDVSA